METNTLISLQATEAVLADYAAEVQRVYKERLVSDDRIATEELINSVQTQVVRNDTAYLVTMSVAEHWKWVEWDTRPHWPPPDALLKWITVKPVIPRPLKSGKLPTPKQLAYLIGKKISEVGTKGSLDLTRTVAEVNAKYEPLLAEALQKDLSDAVQGWLVEMFARHTPK